jgi:2-haloacid dehalogenase
MTSSSVRIVVFDAYGTLFDVHSAVQRHAARLGPKASAISDHWRSRQLEYTWTLSLMGRYQDFWSLTELALDHALSRHGITDSALRADLLDAYRCLGAFAEVPAVLSALRASGLKTAVLSNGTPGMLDDAVRSTGLMPLLDAVLSVHGQGIFKPSPAAYAPVEAVLGESPGSVAFVSSNRWDVAGAASFGFRCIWVNRGAQPAEYHASQPLAELRDLTTVPGIIAGWA